VFPSVYFSSLFEFAMETFDFIKKKKKKTKSLNGRHHKGSILPCLRRKGCEPFPRGI
jgi:hypothetical protein